MRLGTQGATRENAQEVAHQAPQEDVRTVAQEPEHEAAEKERTTKRTGASFWYWIALMAGIVLLRGCI